MKNELGEETQGDNQRRLMYLTADVQNSCDGFNGGRGRGRGGSRGRGRGRGKHNSHGSSSEQNQNEPKTKPKRDYSKVVCYRCDKAGHFPKACPERPKNMEKQETNMVEMPEADGALYMNEIMFLSEEKVFPKNFEIEDIDKDIWYLDNGASDHMTRNKSFFTRSTKLYTGR